MISQPGDYDISEILCRHVDHVDASLEVLKSIVDSNSKFSEALKTKQGGNFVTFLTQYESAVASSRPTLPKMDSSMQSFGRDHLSNLEIALIIIDSLVNWMHVACTQLVAIDSHSQEFDLQWNNLLSVQVCQIFVKLNKVSLFFHYFPNCRIIVLMANHFDKLKNIRLSISYKDLLKIITKATANPFGYLNDNLKPLSQKFSSLIASIGPFFLRALGSWPIVNWQEFIILERQQHVVESTLPSLPRIVLMNMTTIFETVLFFSFVFPRIVSTHSQFYSLMENVFSDCPFAYITRTYKVSINQIYETFKIMGSSGEQKLTLPISLFVNVRQAAEIKDQISHIQRMKHIYLIVKDIVEISAYDISYLPRFIYDVIPLAGFAAYELRTGLMKGIVNSEIAQLLSLMVELAQLISKNKDFISRFFLFNLGTIDLNYLNQITAKYSEGGEEWQNNIVNQFRVISESLSSLDLDAFDKGTRYDTTPLITTIGRCFYHFNNIKLTERAGYMHSAYEHIMTIYLHLKLMSDPLGTFLEICPLHKFWTFRDVLSKYSDTYPGGIQYFGSIITLVSFFNLDNVVLTLLEAEDKRNGRFVTESREKILNSIKKIFSDFLGPTSNLLQVVSQNRFFRSFNFRPFHKYTPQVEQNRDNNAQPEPQINYVDTVLQLKELMRVLPGVISTGIGEMTITDFLAKSLTEQVNTFIVPSDHIVPPFWIDAAFSASTQLLWPIFSLLGVSYPRKLMEIRFENSKSSENSAVLFSNLILAMKNPSSQDPGNKNAQKAESPKFIDKFVRRLTSFLESDYRKTIYRTHGHCFENITTIANPRVKGADDQDYVSPELRYLNLTDGDLQNAKISYEAADYFSEEGFRYLISNLGLHAGFSVDVILVNEAVNSIIKIYSIYKKIPELDKWFSSAAKTNSAERTVTVLNHCLGDASSNKDIAEAAQELVHLGVILTTRKLLRDAMSESVDTSMPGMMQLLSAAFLRTQNNISQREDFVKEIASNWNNYKFIKYILESRFEEKKMPKENDPMKLFCFLSLLLDSSIFDDVKFIPDNEMMTRNMHLIPVAIEGFINVLDVFSNQTSDAIITSGVNIFFRTLQKIYNKKRSDVASGQKKGKLTQSSVNALIILGDLFPKFVKSVEYGRIGQCFQYSLVNESYREIESEYRSEKKEKTLSRKKSLKTTMKY